MLVKLQVRCFTLSSLSLSSSSNSKIRRKLWIHGFLIFECIFIGIFLESLFLRISEKQYFSNLRDFSFYFRSFMKDNTLSQNLSWTMQCLNANFSKIILKLLSSKFDGCSEMIHLDGVDDQKSRHILIFICKGSLRNLIVQICQNLWWIFPEVVTLLYLKNPVATLWLWFLWI